MDKKLLDILVCPVCKSELVYKKSEQELICKADRLAYPIRDDIPVMLEITSEGKYGWLFQTGRAKDLAKKANELLKNGMGKKEKVNSASIWAREQFSIVNYLENLKSLYHSLKN